MGVSPFLIKPTRKITQFSAGSRFSVLITEDKWSKVREIAFGELVP
jgi:hypothetical protein